MSFSDGARVVVEQVDPLNWRVVEGFDYTWNDLCVVVPDYFESDFASIPRVFVWFLPRTGAYTKSALVHDVLWRELAPNQEVSWRSADRIFRDSMHDLEVPFLRRWVMWSAVRLAAIGKGGQWRDWLMTFPAALFFVLLAAVFILIPGILILVSLFLFHIFEWLIYAIARLFHKHLVEPGVDLSTVRKKKGS